MIDEAVFAVRALRSTDRSEARHLRQQLLFHQRADDGKGHRYAAFRDIGRR